MIECLAIRPGSLGAQLAPPGWLSSEQRREQHAENAFGCCCDAHDCSRSCRRYGKTGRKADDEARCAPPTPPQRPSSAPSSRRETDRRKENVRIASFKDGANSVLLRASGGRARRA